MKKLFLSAITLLFVFASCGSSHTDNDDLTLGLSDADMMEDGAPSNKNAEDGHITPSTADSENMGSDSLKAMMPTKVIKQGSFIIETKDLTGAKSKVDSTLKNCGGYTENEEYVNGMTSWKSYTDNANYTLKVRVPAKNFDLFINALGSVGGDIVNKNITITDVSKKYVNLESAKKSKDAEIESYRELLKQAKSVSDIIAVKKQLDELQEVANSTGQELKDLNKDIEFSSIEILLVKPQSSHFWSSIGDSLSQGLVFVTVLLPLILFGLIIYFLVRYIKRKNAY